MSARPVVFIHGLWIHSAAWEPWIPLYRRAGYEPVVAGWPGDAGTVEATRRDATQVAGYGLAEITEHYTKLIADLPERPIIVGHSFGGLIAQQLLARRIATHAVAIDPGPIKGVTKVPLAQIRTAIPVLRKKSNRHAAKALSARQFRYGLGNAISAGESRNLYDRFAIPGPGRPLFRGDLGQEGRQVSRGHRLPRVPRPRPLPGLRLRLARGGRLHRRLAGQALTR
jgi:pimeloyl-ACP methyl ester carboxylesterase